MIEYIAIPGAKFNSVRISLPCFTCPLFIKAMQGGCGPPFLDQCMIDSAMAAAFLELLRENIIHIFQQKLIQVSFSHYISYGYLHVCITLPSPVGTIKYALKCLKKTISPLLAKRTYKLYFRARKGEKKNSTAVYNTIAKTLNGNISIMVFGKAAKTDHLTSQLQYLAPKQLDHSGETIPRVQSMVGAEGPYRQMKQFELLSDPAKAVLLAALQITNFDFFTDGEHKKLFANKYHFSNQQLLAVRKFIAAKTKFLFKPNSASYQKHLVALLSTLYNHSATAIIVNTENIQLDKTKQDLYDLIKNFQDKFQKTKM